MAKGEELAMPYGYMNSSAMFCAYGFYDSDFGVEQEAFVDVLPLKFPSKFNSSVFIILLFPSFYVLHRRLVLSLSSPSCYDSSST